MAEMTNIEVVRLCAEAIGIPHQVSSNGTFVARMDSNTHDFNGMYDPLTNKAQAMDLVIALGLSVNPIGEIDALEWEVEFCSSAGTLDKDLLRAICLCAARVQQAKGG